MHGHADGSQTSGTAAWSSSITTLDRHNRMQTGKAAASLAAFCERSVKHAVSIYVTWCRGQGWIVGGCSDNSGHRASVSEGRRCSTIRHCTNKVTERT